MARAREADDALGGGELLGPLHGVPVTIKESFAYRGSPNTWGVPALKDANSPRTAVAVERLESAGAIVIGKTNVPVMLGDWQSYNPIYGTTNNPWDLSRTPGGSTGGGSAALAAGLGCLTIGSDLSGSIRIPAHFCGVYGHKPSLDLVSMAGFQPVPGTGPRVTRWISPSPGRWPAARATWRWPSTCSAAPRATTRRRGHGACRRRATRASRIFASATSLDDAFCPVASDIGALYENVLSELSKAGAKIERGWPPGIDPRAHMQTFQYLLFALVTVDADERERERARQRLAGDPHDAVAAATVEPHARWLHETQRRLAFRALWQKYFERPRRVSSPDHLHGRVPPRPEQPDRKAGRRDTGRDNDRTCATWRPGSASQHLRACPPPSRRSGARAQGCRRAFKSSRRCGRTERRSSSRLSWRMWSGDSQAPAAFEE